MKSFTAWMEQHFVPVAAKIGSQKHLVAIRDAFIAIMPVTMAGAVATLLNVFFRDLPNNWWGPDNSFVTSDIVSNIIGVNGKVWTGTLAILSLVFVFALGYYIAKAYKAPSLAGGVIAIASFIAVTPDVIPVEDAGAWGIGFGYLGAAGLFTALIVGLLASMVYVKLINRNITIKLPDSVPPAVSKAFTAIIPGLIAIYLCAIIAQLVNLGTGKAIGDLILEYVQQPFLSLSQGFGAVIIVIIAVQLFWFFGIHGTNVLAPVLDGVYLTATNANNAAYIAGSAVSELPYIWTRGSFDAYVWMGGAGCTFALIVAVFIFSKKEESRAIAKLSAPMGAFNINEPVMFGMPIVLNPIYFIPWMIVPVILTIIAYAATALGIVPPVFTPVPWVMPPVIYAFLATGGSITAAILAIINLAIAVVIWGVFVLIGNKIDLNDTVEE